MKNLMMLAATIVATSGVAKKQNITLQKALDNHYVSSQVFSNGGHQGNCIDLTLKNISPDSLIVEVEPGRRFNSIDEKNQDILVTQQTFFVLAKNQSATKSIKGFCCQANNHSPSKGAKYDVNKLAETALVLLAQHLNTNIFSNDAAQNAIWAISDKRPTAAISSQNDTLLQGLRNLVATIKNEPIPWYTLITKTYVFSNGAIQTTPIALRGKLEYSNGKDTYTTLSVVNNKGQEVGKIIKQWTLQGTNHYDLNYPLVGLKTGDYKIELKTDKEILASKEFKI